MFKSVFAKYIFAFMLIIAISFAMLASIVGSVVNSYSVSAKTESVRSASEAVVNCIEKSSLLRISVIFPLFAIYIRMT